MPAKWPAARTERFHTSRSDRPYASAVLATLLLAFCATPIFDGQTLDGFEIIGPNVWRVEDGVIIGSAQGSTEQSWLYWPGTASDFTLTLDFKVDAGNSGVNYRSRPGGQHQMTGYQADLDIDHAYTGALYDLSGRALMTPRGSRRRYGFQDNRQDLGACGDPMALVADLAPGTWHQYEIEAIGPHLVHRIDGRLMSETWDEDPKRQHRSGGIAFQVHPGEDCRVAFRSIDLQPIARGGGIHVPDGFTAERVLDAQAGEGSWVSMAFEPDGNLLVSPQSGRIRRIDLDTGTSTPIDIDIGDAQGMVHAFGALYVTVSRDPPLGGLHRLRDTDGDGRYDQHDHLAVWGNGSEHGVHAIRVGPDPTKEELWIIQGNHTPLPPRVDVGDGTGNSPFHNWAEDLLLERQWDANGHAVGIMAPGGVVLKTDANAESFQIVSGGQRNACDFAFMPDGECFAWDSDMEWDMGMPWYRPPRVVHVLPGSDNGWRSGTGKWEDWYPDTVPPVAVTPPASPTGVVHAGDGGFGAKWEGILLLADWSYGRIWSLRPQPDGASFRGDVELFAEGRPFNVSCMRFAPKPDGALYCITGGRGTASTLWRIAADEPSWVNPRVEPNPVIAQRTRLETQTVPLDEIWRHLGTGDQAMSNAARCAMDRHPLSDVRKRSLATQDPATTVDAWTYLATRGSPQDRRTGIDLLLTAAIAQPHVRAAALRGMALTIARQGDVELSHLLPTLTQLQADDDPSVRYHAAEIAMAIGGAQPEWLLEQLESSQGEQAFRWALLARLHAGVWSPEQELHYLRWLRRHQNVIGGHSAAGFVRAFEARFVRDMNADHRAALLALLDADAIPPPARPTRPHVEFWTVDLLDRTMSDVQIDHDESSGRGERVFIEARCVECHRFRGRGGSAGPDLTGIGSRMSQADLLVAILDPSGNVTDQYAPTWVETDEGLFTGRVLDLDAHRIVLDVDPYAAVSTMSIPRANILNMELSDVSTMPVGLLNTFSPGEIKALLDYLQR